MVSTSPHLSKKRKLESGDALDDFDIDIAEIPCEDAVIQDIHPQTQNNERNPTTSNKKKKRKIKKPKQPKENDYDVINEAIKNLKSVQDQASLFWSKFYCPLAKDLSSIELDERELTGSHFIDFFSFDQEKSKDNVGSFVQHVFPTIVQKCKRFKPKGSPLCFILTSSALRASHLVSSLRTQLPKCQVAKLFAKHIKVEEQVDLLKTKSVHIGVGTPNRILKLRDELNVLDLDNAEVIILDCFVDGKQRTIFTQSDTQADLFTFFNAEVVQRIKSGKCKLVLF